MSELGGLNLVVNNAGVASGGPLEALSDEQIEAMTSIDLEGPIWVVRAALSHLRAWRERGGASIINISSSVTLAPVPNFSVYSATKAGLDMLTRCWALDFASDRIRVNSICPGVVETPIFETMMPHDQIGGFLSTIEESVPLGRVGQPRDVAALALFLARDEANYITGAVIPTDGGLSMVSA